MDNVLTFDKRKQNKHQENCHIFVFINQTEYDANFKKFGGAITTRSQNGFVITYHINKYNFTDIRGYLWSTVSSQKRRNGYLQSTVTTRKSGLLRSSKFDLKPRSRLLLALPVGEA